MKYMIHYLLLALLFVSVFIFVEQSQSTSVKTQSADITSEIPSNINNADSSEVVLRIWTNTAMLDYETKQFEAKNPNVKIIMETIENELQIEEKYYNALAGGTAPDLIVMPHRMLGAFNSIDKLADLSAPPFNLSNEYREEIGEYLWDIHQSVDGKRMIAMPYDYYPIVLYYRADLIEEAGFPSEPKELATYLTETENWMSLAKAMNQKGIAISQWEHDMITALNDSQFIFNRDMDYQRSTDVYKKAIDVMVQSKNLSANVTIWSENGLEMLKNGKLAMVIMPIYGEDILNEWLPEQAGKWRVTGLPLGASGIDLNSSKSIAVTMQSKHKDIVAKLLQDIRDTSGSMNWLKGRAASPFLRYQDSGTLYLKLIREQPVSTIPTPLDEKAVSIWKSAVDTVMFKGITAEESLGIAHQQIMDVVDIPKRQILDYIGRHTE